MFLYIGFTNTEHVWSMTKIKLEKCISCEQKQVHGCVAAFLVKIMVDNEMMFNRLQSTPCAQVTSPAQWGVWLPIYAFQDQVKNMWSSKLQKSGIQADLSTTRALPTMHAIFIIYPLNPIHSAFTSLWSLCPTATQFHPFHSTPCPI